MTQRTVIESLPQAFEVIKEMGMSEASELDYRGAGARESEGCSVKYGKDRGEAVPRERAPTTGGAAHRPPRAPP